jgi:hypothetical protein
MRSGGVSAQPTWVPHTSGTASGSWPTPTANSSNMCSVDAALNEAQRLHPRGQWTLMSQVAAHAVPVNRMWPTPSSRDGKGGYIGGRIRNGKVSWDTLDVAVQSVSNPNKVPGQLNPTWVTLLMGYPSGWLEVP